MTSLNKFVVRILDDAGTLLAWAEVYAEPRPQARGPACPWWPTGPTSFAIERAGVAKRVSVHWCDLDIARVQQLVGDTPVEPGQVFTMAWIEPVWLVQGMRGVPLPTVTVRQSVTLAVPAGALAAVGEH